MPGTPPAELSCSGCGGGVLKPDQVSTALWRADDLVVIENIPALVCQSCGERYFEDETAMALDMMHGGKGTGSVPVRTISVPVYSFAVPGMAAGKGGGE
jgi:YgiT-type zinc finger domain-containing protein